MGNVKSKEATKDQPQPFEVVYVESTTKTEIKFNPNHSRAVCAGVGKHFNVVNCTYNIPVHDEDPGLLAHSLTSKLGIPPDNVSVLNTSGNSATLTNIKKEIQTAGEKLKEGGILLFYVSGHATNINASDRQNGLVPADYDDTNPLLITTEWLAQLLKDNLRTKRNEIVVILDCCFAACFSNHLCSVMRDAGFSICGLAACSAIETCYISPSLEASVFTYFMDKFLNRNGLPGCLPLQQIVDYCCPVCNALANLVVKDADEENYVTESVHPEFNSIALIVQITGDGRRIIADLDETDGPTATRFGKTLQMLQHYLNLKEDFDPGNEWSSHILKWFQKKAEEHVEVLKGYKTLADTKVLQAVFCQIMHSVAVLTVKQCPDLALQPFTPVLCYFRVAEMVGKFEEKAMNAMDDFVCLAVQRYVEIVYQCMETDSKRESKMRRLAGLYTCLSRDKWEDEPDGGAQMEPAKIISPLPTTWRDPSRLD